MKFVAFQMAAFLNQTGARRNVAYFLRFLGLLIALIAIFSILFHYIMMYEGQEHSWLTGVYWTLTVMTTLGFGDITFASDLGRFFSIIVLLAGLILLLVMLPFAFIQYVYSPWLEAQKKTNAPRKIEEDINNHVIIVGLNPISLNLAQLLSHYGFYCVILSPDIQTSIDLEDQGFHVIVGDYDDGNTYKNLEVDKAALVVALDEDIKNTNIIFSAREANDYVPIISRAESADSEDILTLAGSTKVFLFRKMLGEALADRVAGNKSGFSYLAGFSSLLIAERALDDTTLVDKTLVECGIRAKVGVNVVGLWQKGRFTSPSPNDPLPSSATLVLAGTKEQFELFDEMFGIQEEIVGKQKVLVIGCGKVGYAAAIELHKRGMEVSIVDKEFIQNLPEDIHFVLGDAADIVALKEAGIDEVSSVIITTHDDDTNIYLTIYCRRLRPDIQVLSRATLERNVGILHRAGANTVLSLVSMISNAVVNMLTPGKNVMLRDGLSFFSAKVGKNLVGKSLITSKIREKTGCSVVGMKPKIGNILINPDPHHQLIKGEEIFLIGDTESQNKFISLYGIEKF